jgi:uncharacterized protein (DUF1810 family)
MDSNKVTRFLEAQNQVYLKALSEIKNAQKETHWMGFVFPQIKGMGFSEASKFYGIENLEEADSYLSHPVLGKHLIEISLVVLQIDGKTATEIFGTPNDFKLRSCMTLFANVENTHPVFDQILDKYFSGLPDELTLQRIV